MLYIDDLTKIYVVGDSAITALHHINLEVKEGELVSIMGSSGSGKSTLLHMIAGVDTPTSGNVFINKININRITASEQAIVRRRQVGMIYQSFNLIPTLTVEENIILPLLLGKKDVDKNKLKSLLDMLNLTDRKKHLPNQLSGGQQQRVAIGRALMTNPSLILADEPTGNLDNKNTSEVLSLLRTANEKYGQTILIVTHDNNVSSITKRQIIMEDGSIVTDRVV